MRKARSAILLGLGLSVPLAALPAPAVSLTTSAGLLQGSAYEYVYEKDETLSELVWPMQPIVTAGLDLSILWGGRVELSGSVMAGFSGIAGTMTDADFLNVPTSDARTHYSEHEAFLNEAFDLSASLARRFSLPLRGPFSGERMALSPSVGLRGIRYQWTGSDGWYQYADSPNEPSIDSDGDGINDTYKEWNENLPKTPMSGKVIAYSQEYLLLTAGVSLSVPAGSRFRAEIGATLSPFVWCDGTDHHFFGYYFYDILSGGYMVEPAISMTFKAGKGIEILADARWTLISGLRGDTYMKTRPSGGAIVYYESDGAGGGAALDALSVRLGLSVTAD